ncbi:hypothetical protein N0V82_004024 [Gnomoniopsis sp. IMI 355080]|nr:hypothetical protein N0V82_004024 [Gnomoniopsis sp. IMI 355080]
MTQARAFHKAVIWTLTGVATLLLAGRLIARSILVKSFHLDDLFSILAYVLMLAAMIAATLATPLSYQFSAIIVGSSPMPDPVKFADMTITLRKWNFAGRE